MTSAARQIVYFVTVLAGGMLGFLYGDVPFPALEELVGDPLCDIVMGFGGATLAAIGYEIVSSAAGRA